MKKKIFNWLFVLVMLPFMLFVNGCEKDDDNDPGEKEVVTDYDSVNEVLASLNNKKNNIKQFQISGNYKISEIDLEEEEKVGYEQLEWNNRYVKVSIDFENEKYSTKVYNDDESWYSVNYVQNENNQYVGYNKVHYATGQERFNSYLISKDSIVNEMAFVGLVGVNLSKLNYSDYESLKNSYNLLVKEDISRYWALYNFNMEINPDINLYKQNNDYIFEYKLNVTIYGVVVSIDSSIRFNEESVTDYKYFHSYETQYWYDAEEIELKYSTGVDTSLYLTDFSDFTEEPSNDSFRVTAVVDGYVVNVASIDSLVGFDSHSYTPGEKFTYSYFVDEGIVLDGWYLDPEYKVKLDTLEDCPSYDIIIYAKTRAVDDNHTVVVTAATIDRRVSTDFYVKFECIEKGSEYLFEFENQDDKKIFYFKWKSFYFNNMTINGDEYEQESFVVGNEDKYYIEINGEKEYSIFN